MRRSWMGMAVAVVAATACDSNPVTPPESDGVAEPDLVFVQFADSVLPLAEKEGSFWAVKGEDRELVLRYQPEEPGEAGEDFLEFQVSGNSLLDRPDGTRFQEGDSVLITVRVDDAGRFLFEFSPSGLRFDPDHPAELEVTYLRAADDVNGDGTVNDDDAEIERTLSVWRQEGPGEPWFEVASLHFEDMEEIEADIVGFSRFALASR